jgi:hypothetical protein
MEPLTAEELDTIRVVVANGDHWPNGVAADLVPRFLATLDAASQPADPSELREAAEAVVRDAVTVISREKPHNHNVNECHDCYALTHRPRPADPSGLTPLEMEEFDERTEGWNTTFRQRVRAALLTP